MSLSSYRAKRTFPSRTVTICLDAALSAEKDRLLRQRFAAGDKVPPALAKAFKDLDARMTESLLTIKVVGVPFAEYHKIQMAHPARKDVREPYNPLTFYPDVVYKTGLLVEGETETPLRDSPRGEWDELVAGFTSAEMIALTEAVDDVNGNRVNPDFLLTGSATIPGSSETSGSPATSE